jgi:hypothetical protein
VKKGPLTQMTKGKPAFLEVSKMSFCCSSEEGFPKNSAKGKKG